MKKEIEWLETDGLGGFAMGTASLIPRRRYHSLLTHALTPPTNRMCLVNALEIYTIFQGKRYLLSSFEFNDGDGGNKQSIFSQTFESHPWPKWIFRSEELALQLEMELLKLHNSPLTLISWKQTKGRNHAAMEVRPLISIRDQHALHFANESFEFEPTVNDFHVEWSPYENCPSIQAFHNGIYNHSPLWFYKFFYSEEKSRGFDFNEDLASPGSFIWELGRGEAHLVLSADQQDKEKINLNKDFHKSIESLRREESQRRIAFPSPLHRAADSYLVKRGDGISIIAGYPWFTDWGRDTFIAFRGICVSSRRYDEGADILSAWSKVISKGMIPNRFPDFGEPEYNSVDASLWYIVAAFSFMKATPRKYKDLHAQLKEKICEVVQAYYEGTRFNIKCDEEDGLLMCGLPGTQLTWMDAKIGQTAFTPRVGKPVEVQALWINALQIASRYKRSWKKHYNQAVKSFRERFFDADKGYLYDVIDVDHKRGTVDPSLRPNQLLAIGGLPIQVLEGPEAKRVVDICEKELFTPFGMRTLSPRDERFSPRYEGGPFERDSSYHQGTSWPWLLGPFVEAWVRVQEDQEKAKVTAKKKFLSEILSALFELDGAGHISEIHDPTAPFQGRGCPFQAWSVAEVLRLFYQTLHSSPNRKKSKK